MEYIYLFSYTLL